MLRLCLLRVAWAWILFALHLSCWAGVYNLSWGMDQLCADRSVPSEGGAQHLAHFKRAGWTARPWPELAGALGQGSVVIEAEQPKLALLYFPGGRARAVDQLERLAEAYQGLSVSIWVMEYPGCGSAPGKPSLAANRALAQAALRHIRQYHPGRPVLAHGLSYGSLMAAEWATPAAAVDGLILESAITNFEELLRGQVRRKVGRWLDWAVGVELQDGLAELDARKALKQGSCLPLLILQGESDTLTPLRFSEDLQGALSCAQKPQLALVPGAGHAQALEFSAGRQALQRFLAPFLGDRP